MKNAILSVIAAVTLVCTDHTKDFTFRGEVGELVAVVCPDGKSEFDWPALRIIANKLQPDDKPSEKKFLEIIAFAMVAAHDNKTP